MPLHGRLFLRIGNDIDVHKVKIMLVPLVPRAGNLAYYSIMPFHTYCAQNYTSIKSTQVYVLM